MTTRAAQAAHRRPGRRSGPAAGLVERAHRADAHAHRPVAEVRLGLGGCTTGRRQGPADDRGNGEREADELEWRQVLTEHDPSERRPGDRSSEAEQGRCDDRQSSDSLEPQHEGARGRHDAEVHVADDVRHRRDRGRTLRHERQRHQQRACDHHLPAGGGDAVPGRAEPGGQHDPERERPVGADGGNDADRIEAGAGPEDDEPDAERREEPEADRTRRGALPEERPGEGGDQQRLQPAERRGDTAGEPFDRHGQQGEEDAEVGEPQQHCPTPVPAAGRPPTDPPGHDEEDQPGWSHAHGRHQERSLGRQQLGDGEVRRPPGQRRNDRPHHMILHVRYLNVEFLDVQRLR